MDKLPIPPSSLPPDKIGPLPPGLPPRHKVKSDPVSAADHKAQIDEEAEAQLQAMLDEEAPPIPDLPPQCDWHLNALASGNHPDPFSLPALHTAKQVVMHSMAAFVGEIVEAGKEALASEGDSKDTSTK